MVWRILNNEANFNRIEIEETGRPVLQKERSIPVFETQCWCMDGAINKVWNQWLSTWIGKQYFHTYHENFEELLKKQEYQKRNKGVIS